MTAAAALDGLDGELTRLLETARTVITAEYAALGILDPERLTLERFLTAGVDGRARAEIGHLPRGRGVLGLLIEDPVPLRLDDLAADPRSYGFPAGHPVMRSFLGVPVLIYGEAGGNLYFTDKHDGAFDEADEYAATAFAERAALLVEQARSMND
jgi:GAF domain-containing protein